MAITTTTDFFQRVRLAGDPHAHPEIVPGAEGGRHRSQPVVAVVPAALLEPQHAERKVKLIMDDGGLDEIAGQTPQPPPTTDGEQVVEGEEEGQQ